ncbi:LOW QUALITY PROTEIN: hypothetical protein MAR_026761 [Mya arenaria]|uniref:G-protein coupled receptors family 1 profile domain-containing protein n=1 Tax=Mya arenaria TaxID=6604 RepID=A0ABY7EZL2_MYAAR|nr:LOW QUALITY PROTEIN: hypothetical protein MAR_026761 [Mya arenaria]
MLRQHSSFSGRSGTQVHKRQDHGEVSQRITCMLLAVSFTFLITTIPMNIYIIYTSKLRKILELLSNTISEMLMYTNHSISFILLTGKKFRSQARLMMFACNTKQVLNRFINRSDCSLFGSFRLLKLNTSRTDYVNCSQVNHVEVQM